VPNSPLQRIVCAYPTFYAGIGEAVGEYAEAVGKVIDMAATPEVFDSLS